MDIITSFLQSLKPLLPILIPFIVLALLLPILFLFQSRKEKYAPKALLTATELKFFRQLLPQAENQNLFIFPMVRLADIAQVDKRTKKWQAAFNKIQSKHVDFVLCDKDTLQIKIIIELDDRTHDRPDRQKRDIFVDYVMSQCNYQILHITPGQKFTLPNYECAAL